MSTAREQDKTAKELRREREQRITDVINLKITDRVPVACELGYFAARYAGMPCSVFYYDCEAWLAAYRKTLQDFQPDMAFIRGFTPGKALEYLDPKFMKWPGYGLDPHIGFQVIEIESLKDDEYDFLISNPADFFIRHHLPRLNGSLEFLSMLPKLSDTTWIEPWSAQNLAILLTEPGMEAAVKNLQEAGREIRKWLPKMREFDQLLMDFGMPQLYQGGVLPPFDVISHSVRGMKGTMLDMYRRPDKLLAACEFLLEKTLSKPLPKP
ncbi:MAG TPA: hypothetical protein VLL97_01720, partial [Acidobacteriota bacterium]|nr:hypothetical protein [Acidobacteriota bacterium]